MFDFLRKHKKEQVSPKSSKMAAGGGYDFIFVGLGNPGPKYEQSRHNAGFMALDLIAAQQGVQIKRIRFKGLCGECSIEGNRILLLKPATFMNLSGQSVTEAMRYYQLPPERVLLFFDDISLPPGKIRIRRKGSHGGQNGVKNIIYLSGSDAFPRVKIGIGAKPHPDYDLADWVLSRFTPKEQTALSAALENAAKAAELIVKDQLDEAMSRYNGA